jgi:sirohydrochlorin cobaltochelatase
MGLAGGPPHRGTLLEPASREVIAADTARYAAVVREFARGLGLVTGLAVETDGRPGWIGLVCRSETMRAIVVENVLPTSRPGLHASPARSRTS